MNPLIRSRNEWKRQVQRVSAIGLMGAILISLAAANAARAGERKFVVMLAHSPKSHLDDGAPGLPPGGLSNVETIRKDYFDRINPDIDSFAEYWEEISYQNVTVTGDVYGWVILPWAFDPAPPNAEQRTSPADYINLRDRNTIPGCPPFEANHVEYETPQLFAYGAGEEFCDCFTLEDSDPELSLEKCGALIITDLTGGEANPQVLPARGLGLPDFDAVGVNVWTPGERFIDLDDDRRWDGLDEKNDMMCHGEFGCRNTCTGWVCSDGSRHCETDADCSGGAYCKRGTLTPKVCRSDGDCVAPETCGDDGQCSNDPSVACSPDGGCPVGELCILELGICTGDDPRACGPNADCGEGVCIPPGPRGCDWPGCGDLATPCMDWDGDGDCTNESGCFDMAFVPCSSNEDCDHEYGCLGSVCYPETCHLTQLFNIDLDPCCPEGLDPLDQEGEFQTQCVNGPAVVLCSRYPDQDCEDDIGDPSKREGVICGDPVPCCEFQDIDGNTDINVVEPFEDFLVRWNPAGYTAGSVWVPVSRDYIRNNYPGDVDGLLARVGDGYYSSPDMFFDTIDPESEEPVSTKLMQDAGSRQYSYWRVPKPGTYSPYVDNVAEQPWFDQMWQDRYHSNPPPWPAGENSPRMRAFDPLDPSAPVVPGGESRRWFRANRGGWNGFGVGTADDPNEPFNLGGDDWDNEILPEEAFGYYDGWVEHDDLPSSKYHGEGDKRFGEVTSPSNDTVIQDGVEYPAIFGTDLGMHDPNSEHPFHRDFVIPAAGPYAVNIHGEKGYDAGDVSIVEWLTWRRDGQSRTVGYQWEIDNANSANRPYHPYAGPKRCSGDRRITCETDADCDNVGTCTAGARGFGFADYNLDGMIDQGEVRPENSENYSTDSDPTTPNDGHNSNYPFNRRRMLEDIVEALDPTVNWDSFVDANSMRAVRCADERYDPNSVAFTTVCDPQAARVTGQGGQTFVTCGDDSRKSIPTEGFVSGVVFAPPDSWPGGIFGADPGFYPIHNQDNDDPTYMFPDWANHPFVADEIHRSFNLQFHDLVLSQFWVDEEQTQVSSNVLGVTQHYLDAWQGFPELWDQDRFQFPQTDIEDCPIGFWDIMADGGLVHPIGPLKAGVCTQWIEPVDLATVLTPGVRTALTLPQVELNRENSYYYLQNENRLGERYWFWNVGAGFDETRLPGDGMIILHVDITPRCVEDSDCPGENPSCEDGFCEGITDPDMQSLQQFTAPYSYVVVQADARGDLEACDSDGNRGDDGDVWPGTSGATEFNFHTDPQAVWNTHNHWTGLNIQDIVHNTVDGSILLTVTWTPTNLPGLVFVDPPGGASVAQTYQIRFEATDVHGGTWIRFFYGQQHCTGSGACCIVDGDCPSGQVCRQNQCSGSGDHCDTEAECPEGQLCQMARSIDPDGANFIATYRKATPGTNLPTASVRWKLTDNKGDPLPDGRYFIFAELIPDLGEDNKFELRYTKPRANRNNRGDGSLTVQNVDTNRIVAHGVRANNRVCKLDPQRACLDDSDCGVALGPCVLDQFCTGGLIPCTEDADCPAGTCIARLYALDEQDNRVNFWRGWCSDMSGQCDGPGDCANTWAECLEHVDIGDQITLENFSDLKPRLRTVANIAPDGSTLTLSKPLNAAAQGDWLNWQVTTIGHRARFETWTTELVEIDDVDGTQRWKVNSTLTQPAPPNGEDDPYPKLELPAGAASSATYVGGPNCGNPTQGAVRFNINRGTEPGDQDFAIGDRFSFTTTGMTRRSVGVTIKEGHISEAPTADTSGTGPITGPPPLTVTFDGRNSSDPNGEPLTYEWDFGDGATASSALVDHTYFQARDYTATLIVRNPRSGQLDVATVDIEVTNNPPFAEFQASPLSGPSPLHVTFDATSSSDHEDSGDQLIYHWSFGDGTTANETELPGLEFAQVTHFYRQKSDGTPCDVPPFCRFTARLTVTDTGGKESEANTVIRVGNTDPVPIVWVSPRQGPDLDPQDPNKGLDVVFNASNSRDVDGDALWVDWLWGDGKTNTYPIEGQDGDGNVTHTYNLTGTEARHEFHPTAVFRAYTGDEVAPNGGPPPDGKNWGGTASWTGPTITVLEPAPPVARISILAQLPLIVDEEFTVSASLSSSDVGIESYTWNFGDGTTKVSAVPTATHTYTAADTYTISLTVQDSLGNTAGKAVTIQVIPERPEPPVIEDNNPPDAVILVDPADGFEDITEFTFDARGSSDRDGDDLTFTWAFGDGGALVLGATVTHVYANPGTYVVRLTVRDEHNAESFASQTVLVRSNVGNRAPVALIASGLRTGPAPLTLTFSGQNSYDPDGDPLEFTWEFRQGETLIRILTGPVATTEFRNQGTYSVELIVDDGRGGIDRSDRQTIQVTAAVKPPDPGPGQPVPGDQEPEPSYTQRPEQTTGLCGLGMLMSFMGTWMGLTLMRMGRRRFHM